MEKYDHYELTKDGFPSLGIKSATIWGIKGVVSCPLLYLRKPKHLSDNDYIELLNRLEIIIHNKEVSNEGIL